MFKEFKEFALRGNVMDLAIGVIVGAAFGKIVTSLVNDILMPIIGLFIGKIDFSSLFINLSGKHYASLSAAKANGASVLAYGSFINTLIDFLIVAFVIFLIVKQINRFKQEPVPAEADEKTCPFCFTNIALKATRCPACTSQLNEIKNQ